MTPPTLRKDCYVQALKFDPQDAPTWNSLGTVLGGGGSVTVNGTTYTEKDFYVQALQLDPQDALVWNNLGNVLSGGGTVTFNGATYSDKSCYLKSPQLRSSACPRLE